MLSFSALAVLAIAAQLLFAGVGAAVLPKRQILQTGAGGLFDGIIGPIAANFNISAIGLGPLDVNVTYGPGDEGFEQFIAFLPSFITSAIEALTFTPNTVSLTSVTGQSPSSFGFGFAPADDAALGGFDPTSTFSVLSDPLSEMLRSYLNNSAITTFSIASPSFSGSFNGAFSGFKRILPNFDETFTDLDGVASYLTEILPTPRIEGRSHTTLSFADDSHTGSFPTQLPTFTILPLPFPISGGRLSISPHPTSVPALPTSDAVPSPSP